MAVITTRNYFLALSAVATYLLWGVSLWNGTVSALIRASWFGVFEDGTVFKTNYTGIFVLDFPISLLVAFFFFGTNGHDKSYQYFLVDAYSTLQSAFVWLYIESGRQGAKPSAVANPLIWGLIWQGFGAAISLPLYFQYHLNWIDTQPPALSSVPLDVAKSVPISFALGAVLPAIMGMLPTWIERAPERHQTILALWQPDPVWVSMIQASAILILGRLNRAKTTKATRWIRFSYILAAASSASGHIYASIKVLSAKDPAWNWTKTYLPKTFTRYEEGIKLIDGPWLFLQYDLIIISLSSLSWVYILLARLSKEGGYRRVSLLAWLMLGCLTVGPGTTVTLALLFREEKLERMRKATTERAR